MGFCSLLKEAELRSADDYNTFYRRTMTAFAKDFCGAIRDSRKPRVSGEDGRDALEGCLAINASHLAGTKIHLPLKNRGESFI